MLIDFHMIKNYPPTNLNRDETGSPKSCFFGGTQRGRISSQCLKHSWRDSEDFLNLKLGIRTRYLPERVGDILKERGIEDSYIKEIKKKLSSFGKGEKKQSDKKGSKKSENEEDQKDEKFITNQIMFYSQEDMEAVANIMGEIIKDSSNVKEFLEKINKQVSRDNTKVDEWKTKLRIKPLPVTVDIALFGRMVTDYSFKDVEAALQVSHAISTNTVNFESDFFAAVDDLNKVYSEDSGSAMIGDIDFNSCCYYHYASFDVDQFMKNMQKEEDSKKILETTLEALIKSMALTNPSGKQNSFAGHVLPELICIELKDKKIPISYVNAFASPVNKNNYIEESIQKLKDEIEKISHCYGDSISIKDRIWFSPGRDSLNPKNSKDIKTLSEVLDICKSWVKEV